MRSLLSRALATAMLLSCSAAFAFAQRPISLVVPFPAGGATDVIGRLMAQGLATRLKQSVVVDNRAGAGGTIGAAFVARAAPDGYTLLISSNTTFTVNPALRTSLPYDPVRSFEGIGLIGSSPMVILAHAGLPARNVPELVTLAREKPGQLSYGSFGSGTVSHLAGEMFKLRAGIELQHVPYKGSAPAMTELIGGHIPLMVDTPIATLPQLAGGKVRPLAVTGARRAESLPQVPTLAESGYPGFEFVTWMAIVAPRGLPDTARRALGQALADTLADPAVRAELRRSGIDVQSEPGSAYETRVARELPLLRASVHKAGLQVD
ncbi:tripartite tricarboxylate transporter substrate binding protein [Variovorax sp. V118]|uniref:Bug family tripartite tricarboxylate transporter substrate binding protein n=1 Tax=Variovorax sp. V118 TaxID=3065954 RepID=UPI0034E8E0E8